MTAVTMHPLHEYAHEIPRIAAWFFDEWRALYGEETQASVQRRIETWLTPKQIPTALVAVSANRVVGTVALKEMELQGFSYSPWLAGLFVVPALRGKGIGALLVKAAEVEAVSLGIPRLYLYTPAAQQFYTRLGWSFLEQHQLPTGPVAVMSKQLNLTRRSTGPAAGGLPRRGIFAPARRLRAG